MINNNKPILLVEDDIVDIMTVKRAVKELKISNPLHVAENGEEGLAYLEAHKDSLPCIILLDINMPRMNGIEFLRIVKENPVFKLTPVIVVTTSNEDRDRWESFNNSAAGYMIKPVDYRQFVSLMATIEKYWTFSQLP